MSRSLFLLPLVAGCVVFAAPPALRVGVYDSRAVALAYGRSAGFAEAQRALRGEFEKARQAGDQRRVRDLEQEGQWAQVRLHQQVFSTGPVSSILDRVKDRLPALAKTLGVALIVSRWEMPFVAPGVETVDVTLPIVELFHPSPLVRKMAEQMMAQPPVAFEKLPLDPKL